jgi:polysaccharide biosynthesis/export protein
MKKGLAVLAIVLGSLAGATAQETAVTANNVPPAKAARSDHVSVTSSETGPIAGAGPSYVIGPEDTLFVAVWKEPDLTMTLPVRPDGMISLPLVNDVPAAGLTPMQLAGVVSEKLKRYVAAPRVTVVVTQIKPQRIFVLGEVTHTGAIPLVTNMTFLQALASAGLTPFANTKGIYLLRTENGQQRKIAFNYRKVIKGGDVAQNILLKPGDTIVVP